MQQISYEYLGNGMGLSLSHNPDFCLYRGWIPHRAFDQNDESEEDGEGQRDEASESWSEPEIRTRHSSVEKVCLNFNPCNFHWDIICRLGPRNAMPHIFRRYDHVIVDVHYSMHLSFEGSKMESQVQVPCPTCYKGNVFSEYRKNFTLTSNVAFNLVC